MSCLRVPLMTRGPDAGYLAPVLNLPQGNVNYPVLVCTGSGEFEFTASTLPFAIEHQSSPRLLAWVQFGVA